MANKTDINKLVGVLFGDAFTGKIKVSLKKGNLTLESGDTKVATTTDGATYQLAENPATNLTDGVYSIEFKDGYAAAIEALVEKPSTKTAVKPTKGTHSSMPGKRVYD